MSPAPPQKASSAETPASEDLDLQQFIYSIRGQRVMIDSDLAHLYGVPTKAFNQAIKRNRERFPEDFCFQLTPDEVEALRSQSVTSKGRGGRRTLPYAFTEHGALQAANILNSSRAVAMSIYVIRAFVRMRDALTANEVVSRRLAEIETTLLTHDAALRELYETIRPLLLPSEEPSRRQIGFGARLANNSEMDPALRLTRLSELGNGVTLYGLQYPGFHGCLSWCYLTIGRGVIVATRARIR
jgi:ORF6N domain